MYELARKNGKLIFEGDIIVWDYDELDIDGSTHTMPQAVVWNKRLCGFVIEKDDNIDENCRVIGNIHDNPEIISERTN